MAQSPLMKILSDCENHLGWIPPGGNLYKSRAMHHSMLTRAMTRQGIDEADLALAVAYCRRKRLPITHPLQLLPFVAEARTLAHTPHLSDLDRRQIDAIEWEQGHGDDESSYWIGRLSRAIATGLADVLVEWMQAGRGS